MNMDPDDYIKQFGGEAFREKIIENPHSFMSFIMAVCQTFQESYLMKMMYCNIFTKYWKY